jgi:hypothetical protein
MLHSPEGVDSSAISFRYINLARACLSIDNYIDNISISSVDAMILQIAYLHMTDNPTSGARPWLTLGIVMKIAQAVRTVLTCVQ